jgi:hypothetical protein
MRFALSPCQSWALRVSLWRTRGIQHSRLTMPTMLTATQAHSSGLMMRPLEIPPAISAVSSLVRCNCVTAKIAAKSTMIGPMRSKNCSERGP